MCDGCEAVQGEGLVAAARACNESKGRMEDEGQEGTIARAIDLLYNTTSIQFSFNMSFYILGLQYYMLNS